MRHDEALFNAEAERIRESYRQRESTLDPSTYSWCITDNLFRHVEVCRATIGALKQAGVFPPHNLRILDVGCGRGGWLLEFLQWGANPAKLAGIDLLHARAERALQVLPTADIRVGDATALPWGDGAFDMVSQFVVLSSILDDSVRRKVAQEIIRVLRPGGIALSHDLLLDNPRNRDVRGLPVAELKRLFPNCQVSVRRIVLAPPIARLVAPRSWTLASMLEKLPFLRTHSLAVITKP